MYKEKQDQLFRDIEKILNETDYRLIKETVGIELKKRNLSPSIIILASEIIMKNAKVEQLVDNDDIKLLFFFTDALSKALKNNHSEVNVKLEDYFLKGEMVELLDYKIPVEEEKIFPIVLTDFVQLNDHRWQGIISSKDMDKLNRHKVPIYNPNTQRNPRSTKKGDKITLFPNKVASISEELQNETYEPDEIIWNVLKNGDEKIVFNPKNRTLTIYEGSTINIVDGMHRKEGNSDAISKKPDLEYLWPLSILNVSEVKAHEIMVQKNKQTKMSEEWLATKDYNKAENRVLSIMKDERSNIFDIMKETDKHITNEQALVKKSNISKAIEEQYSDLIYDSKKQQDNEGIRLVGRWLAEFFDYFIKLYSNEFIEYPYEAKEISFINWKNMFYGYVALSKALMNNDDWKNLLKEKMFSIDFSKDNQLWQNMGMLNTKDANVGLRKKLYNIFKEGIAND
jgi:hypothetical protein